jgi:hypothetical protein
VGEGRATSTAAHLSLDDILHDATAVLKGYEIKHIELNVNCISPLTGPALLEMATSDPCLPMRGISAPLPSYPKLRSHP